MYTTYFELVVFTYLIGKSMNNLLSYCGLVDVRINASDKDLPVQDSNPDYYLPTCSFLGCLRLNVTLFWG